MATFETTVDRGREAEAFNTAFYRFAELRTQSFDDGLLSLVTEPLGPQERKVVRLWSEDAAHEFQRFWNMYPGRPRMQRSRG